MKTLVIEDDAETAGFIAAGLRSRGHELTLAADGREGFEIAAHETFDVIILDRMLPGLDGLSVVALLRAEGVSTPVLFLTNLSGLDDRVEGLGAGGDDYLVKPFAFEELLARLYALARRPTLGALADKTRSERSRKWIWSRARCAAGGEAIDLQPREFRLLEYLMRSERPGRDAQDAARAGLGEYQFRPEDQYRRDSHQPFTDQDRSGPNSRPEIQTVRGAGYALRASA